MLTYEEREDDVQYRVLAPCCLGLLITTHRLLNGSANMWGPPTMSANGPRSFIGAMGVLCLTISNSDILWAPAPADYGGVIRAPKICQKRRYA